LDIIPVLKSNETSARFATHDKDIRALLHDNLEIKVSKGDDLTRFAEIGEFTDPDTIGGDKDDSTRLTKRILVLTEGRQAGGNYSLQEIRRQILCAYAGAERTRGRHVLSFCNDVARYYRTLCIEYKA